MARKGGYVILDLSAARVERKIIYETLQETEAPVLITGLILDSVNYKDYFTKAVFKDEVFIMETLLDGFNVTVKLDKEGNYTAEKQEVGERFNIKGGTQIHTITYGSTTAEDIEVVKSYINNEGVYDIKVKVNDIICSINEVELSNGNYYLRFYLEDPTTDVGNSSSYTYYDPTTKTTQYAVVNSNWIINTVGYNGYIYYNTTKNTITINYLAGVEYSSFGGPSLVSLSGEPEYFTWTNGSGFFKKSFNETDITWLSIGGVKYQLNNGYIMGTNKKLEISYYTYQYPAGSIYKWSIS